MAAPVGSETMPEIFVSGCCASILTTNTRHKNTPQLCWILVHQAPGPVLFLTGKRCSALLVLLNATIIPASPFAGPPRNELHTFCMYSLLHRELLCVSLRASAVNLLHEFITAEAQRNAEIPRENEPGWGSETESPIHTSGNARVCGTAHQLYPAQPAITTTSFAKPGVDGSDRSYRRRRTRRRAVAYAGKELCQHTF